AEYAKRRVFRQPTDAIRERERRLDDCDSRLKRAVAGRVQHARHQAEAQAARLASLSPLNVLARGYSLTRTQPNKHVVSSVKAVHPGDAVQIMVSDGTMTARIEDIQPNA